MQRFWLALALAFVAACVPDAQPRVRTAHDYYVDGMLEYQVGQYEEALEAFENSYVQKPDPVLLFDIGQANRHLGKYEEALQNYRDYLATLPESANRAAVEELIAQTRKLAARRRR